MVPTALRGDPGRIRQIILNLLGNALKFTEQGEVVLQVTEQGADEHAVILWFDITDTGIGLTPEEKSRLFQSFSQADSSTTRKYGGTGLGLVIFKQLVQLMGGEIGVESKPENGSLFWFTLRLEKQIEANVISVPLADMEGLRILLVDDHATNRRLLQHYTEAWGMHAENAADGFETLSLLPFAVA